jgi:hypothetical protein
MTICGVMNEGDLPETWGLLPQYGKKDRLAVELALKQTAQCEGLTHSAPIVMQELTKRPLSLNFAGNDSDNLSEGVQPFDLVIVDHRSQMSRDAMGVGRDEATHYDLVTAGQANTSLSDTRSLRGSTHAHVSFDMIHMEAMIDATVLVLRMMLGSDHRLVISAASFMDRYLSIQHCLASHCVDHHEAKFVHYFSVRLTNWFHRMESPPILLAASDFEQIFDRIKVDDPTCCPALPAYYMMLPQSLVVPPSTTPRMATSPASTVPTAAPVVPSPSPAPARARVEVEVVRGPPVVP